MKLLLLSMLATAAFSPGKTPLNLQSGDWTLSRHPDSDCSLETSGSATDAFGANLFIHCSGNELGNAVSKISAQRLHQRRVTVSGEIRRSDVATASLWVKVLHQGKTLMFETTADQSLYDDVGEAAAENSEWVRRSVTLPVPSDATTVSYGLLLQDGREASVRNLQLTASGEGAASDEARQVLDAALAIVKAQTVYRNDIAWQALEPQVRVFAAAAEQTADVYPAIRYLLAQLGDRHSLLLTPELAALFHGAQNGQADQERKKPDAVSVFTLPDGAKLVLSSYASEYDRRTAKVWPQGK